MQTKELADFTLKLTYGDLPAAAVNTAKMCIEDILGVALAGSMTPQGKIWRTYFHRFSHGTEAPAWESGFPFLSYQSAAALNAAYGHLMDMDDVHNASITHLGAVTIPTALALGCALHRSGRDVLAAISAGYEIGARVGEAINPSAYHFWHTTAVVGALASAVAAGKLLRLTPEQMCSALGSAGTQAGGLWEFLSDGAMSKPLHTSNATLCGIRSAELAQLGLTGASQILEGSRGLVRALSPEPNLSVLTEDLDAAHLRILQNSFKPYACCRHLHAACNAVEELMEQQHLRPENICFIRDRTYSVAKNTIDCPYPHTPYAGKFSAQYCIAAMLCRGTLMDSVFSVENLTDPVICTLMDKITVELDPDLEAEYQADAKRWTHRLDITLEDGTILTKTVILPVGDPQNPFSREKCDEKFRAVTAGILPLEQAERICASVWKIEELEDISELLK